MLLLPVLVLASWMGATPLVYQICLAIVVILMLAEHVRRSKGLELGFVPSLTCVLCLLMGAFFFT